MTIDGSDYPERDGHIVWPVPDPELALFNASKQDVISVYPIAPIVKPHQNLSVSKNCCIFDMTTLLMKCLTNQCHCFLSTTLNASTLGLKFVEVLVDRLLNCQLQLQILNLSWNFLLLLRTQMINLCMGVLEP
jgi:hypothetical protein